MRGMYTCIKYLYKSINYRNLIFFIVNYRKFAPYLEIFRCIIYIPFDYYFVESVEWAIDANERFVLSSTLWTIRISHILSIVFWIGYAIFGSNDSESKVKFTIKDVETTDETKDQCCQSPSSSTFEKCLFTLGILTLFLSLLALYVYNIDSCRALSSTLLDLLY